MPAKDLSSKIKITYAAAYGVIGIIPGVLLALAVFFIVAAFLGIFYAHNSVAPVGLVIALRVLFFLVFTATLVKAAAIGYQKGVKASLQDDALKQLSGAKRLLLINVSILCIFITLLFSIS